MSDSNGLAKWGGHLFQALAVAFAAGILYFKVETVETVVGEVKQEIEPGILPRADERVRHLEQKITELQGQLKEKTQGRFYRWEGEQMRKMIEQLEERIKQLESRRVSP